MKRWLAGLTVAGALLVGVPVVAGHLQVVHHQASYVTLTKLPPVPHHRHAHHWHHHAAAPKRHQRRHAAPKAASTPMPKVKLHMPRPHLGIGRRLAWWVITGRRPHLLPWWLRRF